MVGPSIAKGVRAIINAGLFYNGAGTASPGFAGKKEIAAEFSIDVLLARANACLRRHREPPAKTFEFGDCRFDLQSHQLTRKGAEVALTPKEFRVLEYFARNTGRALTRQEILDSVWGEDLIMTERSVDRCINTLRNKIESDPSRPQFIKTIRDVGYRFELP